MKAFLPPTALIWCAALLATNGHTDELDVLRLSPENRDALLTYLDDTACDCGCGMTVSQCLHEDPVCEASPRMAKDALARFKAMEPAPEASPGKHHKHDEDHHHEHHKQHHSPKESSADEPRGKTGA